MSLSCAREKRERGGGAGVCEIAFSSAHHIRRAYFAKDNHTQQHGSVSHSFHPSFPRLFDPAPFFFLFFFWSGFLKTILLWENSPNCEIFAFFIAMYITILTNDEFAIFNEIFTFLIAIFSEIFAFLIAIYI